MNILDIAIAKKLAGGGGGSGTDNYNDLSNLPKINDTTLSGNKSSSALGLQSEINSDSKLASDLVDDTNQDNKFVTSTEKNTWNAKQNAIDADHKLSSDLVDDANKTNKFVTSTEKNTWNAKQNAIDSDHKLSSDLVDDANKTNKFVTSTEKNTWNAKQNAIDADHKLSSSLVSFSTAEAAALASGIDSSKVGQISTNQTNILYALNTGVKNILDTTVDKLKKLNDAWSWSGNTASYHNVTFTINQDNIKIKATNAGESANFYLLNTYFEEDKWVLGNTYHISGVPSGSGSSTYSLDLNRGAPNYTNVYQNIVNQDITVPIEQYDMRLRIVVKNGSTFEATIPLMMSLPNVYAATPDYQPFALPNYDLTRLEAEDRASLAEVVDSGAKNLLDISGWYVSAAHGMTFTENNGTISVSGTNDGTNTSTALLARLSGAQVQALKGCILSGGVDSGMRMNIQRNASPWNSIVYTDENGVSEPIPDINYECTVNIIIPKNTQLSSAKTFKPMICTKAAFAVSNKFVPYRPNYDLVCQYASVPRTKIAYCGASGDSKTHKYTMQFSDFTYAQFTDTQTCGTYLVSVVTWGYTPKHGLWIVSYSGGNRKYTALTNIVGADAATVSVVTDDGTPYIQVVASGKVTISTLN